MKKIFLILLAMLFLGVTLEAKSLSKKEEAALKAKHVKEQMEREKKFAKEQKFYQGKEYDFSSEKVDKKDLNSIPAIQPENDFDMTDVYRDDI
jgi:cbb3-type cytochrome oxidase subunit 3